MVGTVYDTERIKRKNLSGVRTATKSLTHNMLKVGEGDIRGTVFQSVSHLS